MFFADDNSSFKDAEFVIVGVPFDATASFRKGARFAPEEIRKESYNFESYLFEHDIALSDITIHDFGNIKRCKEPDEMMMEVKKVIKRIVNEEKFPILIGGEHSITFPAVTCFKDIGVVCLDAHLDFRDEYLGEKSSHACSARRISEVVGIENIVLLGTRSFSMEEKEAAENLGLRYIDAFKVKKDGIDKSIRTALSKIKRKAIYLTLDMDVIDPAYAPGVANPEPFGLVPEEVKRCINLLSKRLVGFDVVEVCPPYDNGNTSSLAARLISEVIAVVGKNMRTQKIQESRMVK